MDAQHIEKFFSLLESSIDQNTFNKLILSKPCGDDERIVRVTIRHIKLKEAPHLSFVYKNLTNDITKNFILAAGISEIKKSLPSQFKSANLFTITHEAQLSFSKKGKAQFYTSALKAQGDAVSQEHNNEKQRYIDISQPFLFDLGITDKNKQLIPTMAKKWKQINKFIEVFSHPFESLNLDADSAVNVVDFGSGKGYLTFAVHHYLKTKLNMKAVTAGVELRPQLVDICMDSVKKNQIQDLSFYPGDVRSYNPEKLDVMIALHACDTATDYAIHTGIRLNAKMIMCAPCCHKEIRPQMKTPQVLEPMLKHGIQLGQEAEMLTDSLRALYLEACGYETQIIEFISLEHTSKNKMILAVKRDALQKQALVKAEALKAFYGVQTQSLENLLKADKII